MNRTYDRLILRLAWPALGALMAEPLVSLVDTAFVGQLGGTSLAALGIASAIFGLGFWIFIFLSYGVTPLVSQALGEGDDSRAGGVISSGLIAAVGLGVLVAGLLAWGADPLCSLMGATGEVHREAAEYLRIRAIAIPALLVVFLGHGAFRGYQDTRTPFVISLGLNAVNFILDPILIFGLDWGLAGAAVATVVAHWTGAIWFLYLMGERLGLQVRGVDRTGMWALMRVGRDVVIRSGALVVAFTAAARVAAAIGDTEIAAHQVAMQILTLLAHIADALAIAAQTLVARFVGQGRNEDAWNVSKRLLWMAAVVGTTFAVLLLAAGSVVPAWFSSDDAVVTVLAEVWLILALLQPLAMPIYVCEGVVMGASDFGYLARALVLSMAGSLLTLAFVLPLGWGLPGVWWGVVALNLVRGFALARWYFKPNSRFGTITRFTG